MAPPSKPVPDSTARHTCHCGKSFARKEHLTRHQATHDKLVHICNICKRPFSRKDLLRRHSIVHEASRTRTVVSCDVCRANKTKCSGGTPCLLCARRGIDCTFRGSLHRPKPTSTSDDSTIVNASIDGGENDNDEPVLSTSSRPEKRVAENPPRTPGKHLQPDDNFFLNLTIVASRPVPTSEFQPQSPGMEAMYELLLAEKSSLAGAIQNSDELSAWVDKCIDTYFKSFHLRWPIFHAPTFDIRDVPLPLAASVCVIGAWFQNGANWTERFYALRVHEILLQRLLQHLVDPELILEGLAWPIDLFQATLLTLIFSLYRTDKSALSRAMLLRGAFITLLRELGAFNAESLADHLKAHFTGAYAPYTLSMRERFKRLLVLTFQLDVYFAVAHEKPPMLHRQEVGVDLPSSFALWNAYGLDVFTRRQSEEPPGRSEFHVSEMASYPGAFMSSSLLVEDVQLGLCGLLQTIWVHAQSSPSKTRGDVGNAFQRTLLIETLDAWKSKLDDISELADSSKITTNAGTYLFLAYRGEDDSVAASSERTSTLVQDGMILYYYLKMHHYAGLRAMNQVEELRMESWRTSKDGREALMCALQILKMVDSVGTSNASLNPLIRHALTLGANVMRVVVPGRRCECGSQEVHHAGNMNLRRWTEDGGPIWIDGTPVCACRLNFWNERFQKAIQDQEIMIEPADQS